MIEVNGTNSTAICYIGPTVDIVERIRLRIGDFSCGF